MEYLVRLGTTTVLNADQDMVIYIIIVSYPRASDVTDAGWSRAPCLSRVEFAQVVHQHPNSNVEATE
ncbi:hypothetical protein CEP54_008692 [Fusarium duplospermum]|uniref:Uncharacterized protein n=1 Tax=Fusarium duplospermum TaxID=1325734 RepID=A0A428PUJ2_9HYPO|nr:hypothetical protein CEP54_008692 [Fusarium duplospermum]